MQHIYKFLTDDTDTWTPPPMSKGHRGRYLWTDAFAVLNFITLARETANPIYLSHARTLVSTVHGILGRTRDGSTQLPGAAPSSPLEDEAGSDGDGQYHHYLTIWIFALNRLSVVAGESKFNAQAIELARVIHPRFVYDRNAARPRMYWKLSMDLSRPLVRSEGNLDPVDGYVVYSLLQETAGDESLKEEVGEYKRILETKWRRYGSDDPLDLGMTLWTAHWFEGREEWGTGLAERARRDLGALFDPGYFDMSIRRRLAFREFGTALGIRVGTRGEEWESKAEKITNVWEEEGLVPEPTGDVRKNGMEKLLPISLVMYATALLPGAFKKGYL
ncbi:hypothetical protein LTS18_004536 [Coniosporium uncinatum]|uniref:Uncharacterized protein n=1 Tax=Coniosporium uncinatum TaxID=93489 RepID=A0ACC3D5Z1_9PEZI|nr:hypothetical protein LTS18_004536 [Coniosporium uncinatum]